MGNAYLEAAAAALPPLQLEELKYSNFLPSRGVPPGLTRLTFDGIWAGGPDLELLLLRCSSPASRVQQLCVVGVRGDCILLGSRALCGLQLPQLAYLDLHLEAGARTLELSRLTCPRDFVLELTLGDELRDTGEEWVCLLRELHSQRVLQSQDEFAVNTGACELPKLGLEVLCTMQLERVSLTLPPQGVQHLPAVPEVHLSFSTWLVKDRTVARGMSADVSWSALAGVPGRVCVTSQGFHQHNSLPAPSLHVSGFPGLDSLPSSGPWRLEISGFAAVTGLPSADKGSCILLNKQAAELGW